MIAYTLAFAVGVVLLQYATELPPLTALVAGSLLIVLLFRQRRVVLFALGGFIWAWWSANSVLEHRLSPELEGITISVEGRVIGLPAPFDRGVRFNFAVDSVQRLTSPGHSSKISFPLKVRLSWYGPAEPIRNGQRWRLLLRLKRPHGRLNPGGFDYEQWLVMRGIDATGSVKKSPINQLLQRGAGPFWGLWRQQLDETLSRTLHGRPAAGLVKALVIGARNDISSDQWAVLRKTGTSHLMAISGLHIGLVTTLVFFLIRRTTALSGLLHISPPRVAALFATLAGLSYAAIAGFSIPTRRALIMVVVVMGAIFLQRTVRPVYALSVALFLIILYQPLAVLSASFWLSFLAVAAIGYSMSGRVGAIRGWRAMVRIQWVISLGLAPVTLFFFQQVSLVSPLANLIAVPVVSLVIVPGCLIGAILVTLSPASGHDLLAALESLLQQLMLLLAWLADGSLAQWSHSVISLPALLFAGLGMVLLLAPQAVPGRWLGLVLLVPLIFNRPPRPAPGDLWLTLLDVGQGLSAVVQTSNHLMVFDTGAGYSDDFDMGRAVIIPYLRAKGIDHIDRLILSHSDNDHIGGSASLQASLTIGSILTSRPEEVPWLKTSRCEAGQHWEWDGVQFDILSPSRPFFRGRNDNSCLIKVTSTGGAVLLTGDIEHAAEQRATERYGMQLKSDIMIVPHHGSNTSSTGNFIAAVQPKYAFIPAGYRNRFGFPTAKVVARYGAIGTELLSTAESGAVEVKLKAGKGVDVEPHSYRRSHRRYYHWKP